MKILATLLTDHDLKKVVLQISVIDQKANNKILAKYLLPLKHEIVKVGMNIPLRCSCPSMDIFFLLNTKSKELGDDPEKVGQFYSKDFHYLDLFCGLFPGAFPPDMNVAYCSYKAVKDVTQAKNKINNLEKVGRHHFVNKADHSGDGYKRSVQFRQIRPGWKYISNYASLKITER